MVNIFITDLDSQHLNMTFKDMVIFKRNYEKQNYVLLYKIESCKNVFVLRTPAGGVFRRIQRLFFNENNCCDPSLKPSR